MGCGRRHIAGNQPHRAWVVAHAGLRRKRGSKCLTESKRDASSSTCSSSVLNNPSFTTGLSKKVLGYSARHGNAPRC